MQRKMKKMKKKFVACFMMLLMIISLIPSAIFATEEETMSAEFKAILNEDGKFVMNSAVPATEDEAICFFCENELMWAKYEGCSFSDFNEDFTSCVISIGYDYETGEYAESHRVDVVYNYNPKIKEEVDAIVKKLPKWEENEEEGYIEPYFFSVSDMELVNYWSNCYMEVFNEANLLDYSSEFKELIGYKNFKLDCRAGGDDPFHTATMGFAPFIHDGVLYSMQNAAVKAEHIIYVPDETGDTAEELMAAAQKRIDEYLGKDVAKIISCEKGILDLLTSAYKSDIRVLEEDVATKTKDYEDLLAAIDKEYTEYETAEKNSVEANNKLFELENTKSSLEEGKNAVYEEMFSYDSQINEANGEIERLSNENSDYESSISYYISLIDELERLIAEADNQDVKDQYQQELDANKYQLSLLQGYVAENVETMNGLYEIVAEAEEQINRLNEEISEYDAQLAACEDERMVVENEYYDYMQKSTEAYDAYMMLFNRKGEMESNLQSTKDMLEQAKSYLAYQEESYYNEDGIQHFLTKAEGDYFFVLGVNDVQFMFVVIKDSEKMIEPECKSIDAATNVAVETDDKTIPLDTIISVEKLDEGEKYEEIVDYLKVGENLTFDISLYSSTIGDNISKTDNGKFDVKIPIGADFEGKDLIVYYIDDDKNIHEYEVSSADGYATFETDHFSVYTLAALPEIEVNESEAEVPENIVKDAIKEAGDTDTVVIPFEKIEDDFVSVKLPTDAIKEVAKADKALELEMSSAKLTVDKTALDSIIKEAADEEKISFFFDEIKEEKLNDEQKEAVKEKEISTVFSAEILCADKVISDFEGKVTVKIPFTPEEGHAGSDYGFIHITDDGKIEDVESKYEDGYFIVELEHFSEYAIVKNVVDDDVDDKEDNDNTENDKEDKEDNENEDVVTGDSNSVVMWLALLSIVPGIAAIVVILSKRKSYN